MSKKLHITNGSGAVELMNAAGIEGEKISWDDVLHEGPVLQGLSLREQSRQRARFIADSGWAPTDKVDAMFDERDQTLESHAQFDEVWLWFEHDLYDQLQLIQILDWFNQHHSETNQWFLINPGKHLGYHSPAEFAALAPTRKRVNTNQLVQASQAWQAFTAEQPHRLAQMAQSSFDAFEHLTAAFYRLCQEYPDIRTGLPRTEYLVLESLLASQNECFASNESPPSSDPSEKKDSSSGKEPLSSVVQGCDPGQLFRQYQSHEEAAFLGDTIFFSRLNTMAQSPKPLLKFAIEESISYPLNPQQKVTITEYGVSVLAGNYDWFFESNQTRYIGGCRISSANAVHWNDQRQAFE